MGAKGSRWPLVAAVTAMVAVAAGVRLAGLNWGLPTAHRLFSYHPDEGPLLGAVANMLQSGDWNPHFFNYGTLYLYLVAIPSGLASLVLEGSWTRLFVIGRVLTVTLGVLTVLVVYATGKQIGGWRLGLAAGWTMALLPMHVLHSHFATVDVPATFFVALALLAAAKITTQAEFPWYLVGGMAVGLGAATKYGAGLAVVALVVAHVLGVGEGRHREPPHEWLYVALMIALLAFLAGCPYAIEFRGGVPGLGRDFVHDVSFELGHMRQGGTYAFIGVGNGWAYHLARSLGAGLGYPLLLLALAGMVLAVASRGRPAGPPVVFGLACFVTAGLGKEYFMRYLMPLTPVVAVWAANLVVATGESLLGPKRAGAAPVPPGGKALPSGRQRLGAGLVALVALAVWGVTAWYAVAQLWPLAAPDARAVAGRVLLESDQRIALADPPWFYTPDITPYNGGAMTAGQARADRRLVITEWETQKLVARRPGMAAVSDLESADLVRLGRPQVLAYLDALRTRYQVVGSYETAVPEPRIGPGKLQCPPDWLYARPRITLYRLKGG